MKPSTNSNSVLKTIAISAAAAVLFASSPIGSFANPIRSNHTKTASISESQIDIKYLGSDNDQFQFRVEFDNTTGQKFTLVIKNDEGDVVYSKEFKDVHFAKTVSILKNEDNAESIHPTFAVSVGKRLVQRSFSIERKVTEDVVVTKS
ncbi:MAG TPA: hypothetical protein VNV85_11035 [Puia sp.]|jgi:hypothetical protein|nr:hypothetical protein [Puia sp.]